MSEIEIYPVCAFKDNYVWTLRREGKAAVVDPGDAAPVLDYLRAEKLELTAILNTHHHADHVGGNAELLSHYRVPVYGPHDERIPTVSHRLREGDCLAMQLDRPTMFYNPTRKRARYAVVIASETPSRR